MKIIAFESSCDETSAAVIVDSEVKSNIISSQYFHGEYGGVVPELASRAHLQAISRITERALEEAGLAPEETDAVAVSIEPGLVGSLIVGSNFAKGIALRYSKPIVPINHIEGHIYSAILENPGVKFPFLNLVVSGGHTSLFLVESFADKTIVGSTRDDAAGEAFDKTAKLLGLTYPGGPEIDKLARKGDRKKFDFPRSMINSGDYDFSFSGLKTAVRYFLHKNFRDGVPEATLPDLCASVQAAIVDVLIKKTFDAAKEFKVGFVAISGGVSANSELREKAKSRAGELGIEFVAPQMNYCADNAAMIGFLAEKKLLDGAEKSYDLTFAVDPSAIRAKRKK